MKPPFAHLSPTVLAAFAAGISISLSLFLLPGAGVQWEPLPLLPTIGGAAGRVTAELAGSAHPGGSTQARAASPVRVAVAPVVPVQRVARARPAVHHKVHGAPRAHPRVRVAPPAPVQAVSAVPTTPVTTRRFFSTPKSKGKAKGHSHSHASKPTVGVGSHANEHGQALGRSPEHHKQLPPGQAKKAPMAPPADHGGGKGNKGGKK